MSKHHSSCRSHRPKRWQHVSTSLLVTLVWVGSSAADEPTPAEAAIEGNAEENPSVESGPSENGADGAKDESADVPAATSPPLPWSTSLPKAFEQARQRRRPVFLRFEGDDCPACIRFSQTLDEPTVREELERWTLVSLDVEEAAIEADRLAVSAIPASRLLSPTGKLIASREGAMGAEEFVAWLRAHHDQLIEGVPAGLSGTSPPGEAALKELIEAFDQRDATIREAALRRLTPHRQASAAAVVTAFETGSLSVRLTGLELLKRWGAPVDGLDPWQPETLTNDRFGVLRSWVETTADDAPAIASGTAATQPSEGELDDAERAIDRMILADDAEAVAIREQLARFGRTLLPAVYAKLRDAQSDRARERLTALRYRLVARDELELEWPTGITRLAATDGPTRERAASEFTSRATERDEELLLELFSDPQPFVRELSLRALHRVGGTDVGDALVRLLNDPDPNVRAAVLKQLAEQPDSGLVTPLAEFLDGESDADLVVHAIRVLREAGGHEAAAALLGLVDHDSWRVRAEAVEGIGKLLDTDLSEGAELRTNIGSAMLERLDDEDGFVVSRAIDVVQKTSADEATDELLAVVTRHPDLAGKALGAIAAIGSGDFDEYVNDLLAHDDPRVRAGAISQVVNQDPRPGDERILRALEDKSPIVRRAVLDGLLVKLAEIVKRHVYEPTKGNPPPEAPEVYEPYRPGIERLLGSESRDEQIGAAQFLVAIGDAPAATVLLLDNAGVRGLSSRIAASLPWLQWAERAKVFDAIVAEGSPADVGAAVQSMAIVLDERATERLWGVLERDVGPVVATMVDEAIHSSWRRQLDPDRTGVDGGPPMAELEPYVSTGTVWQRLVALNLLAGTDGVVVGEGAAAMIDQESLNPTTYSIAWRLRILAAGAEEGRRIAIEAIGGDGVAREYGLRYLALDPSSLHDGAFHFRTQGGGGHAEYSDTGGTTIVPEAPDGLTAEPLLPLLESPNPETAALAGYLLALLGNEDGLPALLEFWRRSAATDPTWSRLVYRAIVASNDGSAVPILEELYGRFAAADDGSVREFYWTLRAMSDARVENLRRRIRREVGSSRLR